MIISNQILTVNKSIKEGKVEEKLVSVSVS